jgi:hypothetical protein
MNVVNLKLRKPTSSEHQLQVSSRASQAAVSSGLCQSGYNLLGPNARVLTETKKIQTNRDRDASKVEGEGKVSVHVFANHIDGYLSRFRVV